MNNYANIAVIVQFLRRVARRRGLGGDPAERGRRKGEGRGRRGAAKIEPDYNTN